jgi:predicted dehydrogenase
VNIAVLGSGTIAQFHIRAIREIPSARLVAISSRRAERARETAEREGCAWTADHRELLRRPDVEVVHVTTSSGSHAPIALEALEAGKHVLVEKPMAMTSEDATRLIRKAAEKRLTLGVVSQRRFEEQHVCTKRVLEEGRLGKLLLVEAACPFYRSQEYYDSAEWRGTAAADGGAFMNQAIHSADLLLWLAGPARNVYGKTATRTHRIEAEDVGLALLAFANGAFGSFLASTSTQPGFPPTLALYGEKGTIKIEGTTIAHWTVPDIPKPALADPGTTGAGIRDPKAIGHLHHRLQIEDMLEAVSRGGNPAVTGEDGRRAVALVEGIYRSSATGRPVDLS